MPFSRILIANRGEIACRIMRTAQRMGIETVAVYSEADATARHVRLADEAVAIGPSPARESYLVGAALIEAALATGAQAVHPGYGFLSENESFARACAQAGLVFIGPPVEAIRAMGGKSAAKQLMGEAGVPLTPGYHGADQSGEQLLQEAKAIGWPVLIKASAGGGGKGMRLVERLDDFASALASCQREAQASFGDATMLIEKYITQPRHIEVQVFGDTHGNVVHLFERDCSVQRRHQKVLEEAPAPGMTAERRQAMGEAATRAARAVGYVGAGTVEFIVNQDGTFYFMEMNTRLQVEHPVTELITGLDLVEWQLRVAAGERLPRLQDELHFCGHALEARIYAEDPARNFLPSTGRVQWLRTPAQTGNVRIDSGVEAGDAITPFYDPMIAKLIVQGHDRDEALQRMRAALAQFEVVGVANNIGFLERLVATTAFRTADLDTALIERERASLFDTPADVDQRLLVLAVLHGVLDISERAIVDAGDPGSPWGRADGWRLGGPATLSFRFSVDESEHVATVQASTTTPATPATSSASLPGAHAGLVVSLSNEADPGTITVITASATRLSPHRLRATLDSRRIDATVFDDGDSLWVFADGQRMRVVRHDPLAGLDTGNTGAGGLVAPMPGRIIALRVEAGQRVRKGEPLLVMEAMKMEHTIAAPADGVVEALHFGEGDQVDDGAVLVAFEAGNQEASS